MRQQAGRADGSLGRRPGERRRRRLRGQGVAELVVGRGRELLRGPRVDAADDGLTTMLVNVWSPLRSRCWWRSSAGVADGDLESVAAGLAEGGGGILRRVGCIGAEGRRAAPLGSVVADQV